MRERTARREQSDLEKLCLGFWKGLLIRAKARTNLHANISPGTSTWIAAAAGVSGLTLVYAFGRRVPRVELYIDTTDENENKSIFDRFQAAKAEIESRFGGPLGWERLDGKRACRIRAELPNGSVRDEANWIALQDQMIDRMIRLEAALRPNIEALR